MYIPPSINAPDFHNHGWQVDDDEVKVHWLSRLPVMGHILECASYNCKTVAKTKGVDAKKKIGLY